MSEQKGGFLDFPPAKTGQLYTDREVFAHWAIANGSSTEVAQAFTVVVLVDDVTIDSVVIPGLGSDSVFTRLRVPVRVSEAGSHVVALKLDANNDVAEFNESDNIFSFTATWQSPPTPAATPTAKPTVTVTPTVTSTPAPTPSPPLSTPLTPIDVERAFSSLSYTRMVGVTYPDDGTDRLFLVLQSGMIMVFTNDQAVPSADTFLYISLHPAAG